MTNIKKKLRKQINQRNAIQCDEDRITEILFNKSTRCDRDELQYVFSLKDSTKNKFRNHCKMILDFTCKTLQELQDIQEVHLEIIRDHIDADKKVTCYTLFTMIDLVQPIIDNMLMSR